jgi:hypothetical protein
MVFTRAGFLPGLFVPTRSIVLVHLIGKKVEGQFFTSEGLHLYNGVVSVIVLHFAEKVSELIQYHGLLLVFLAGNKSSFEQKVDFFYLRQLDKVVKCHGFRFSSY